MSKHFPKFILSLILLINIFCAQAQIVDPIKWSFKVEQKNADEATLLFTAKMDEHWHVFSQFHTGDFGLPTVFDIKDNKKYYKLIGKVTEPKPEEEFEPIYTDLLEKKVK